MELIPNSGDEQESPKNILLAVVLTVVFFAGYYYYMSVNYPQVNQRPGSATHDTISPTVDSPSGAVDRLSPAATLIAEPAAQADAIPERTLAIRATGLHARLTSIGAGLDHARLPDHEVIPYKDTKPVDLIDVAPGSRAALALQLPDHDAPVAFNLIDASGGGAVFAAEADGLRIRRTWRPTEHPGELEIITRIDNTGGRRIAFSPESPLVEWLSALPAKAEQSAIDLNQVTLRLGDKVERTTTAGDGGGFFSSLFGSSGPPKPVPRESSEFNGILHWAAVDDRYFCLAVIPDAPMAGAEIIRDEKHAFAKLRHAPFQLASGESREWRARVYAGPKHVGSLKRYGTGLDDLMNFGWFGGLAEWMLIILNYFYKLIPNYGVAIILLTVLVRIVLYPLTYTSYVSMASLKDVAPEMKKLQEKYKDNREKLSKEMMKLYKEKKVNPAGGCLPILLQMPIFFALFYMLQAAIELRGAPFFGWILDLSVKDPWYILPVLMGASMIIQQMMTPTPDPNQQKMMMFMSVAFIFIFLTFPSGLVLYWLVSNILGIAQQKYIQKKMDAAKAGGGEGAKG